MGKLRLKVSLDSNTHLTDMLYHILFRHQICKEPQTMEQDWDGDDDHNEKAQKEKIWIEQLNLAITTDQTSNHRRHKSWKKKKHTWKVHCKFCFIKLALFGDDPFPPSESIWAVVIVRHRLMLANGKKKGRWKPLQFYYSFLYKFHRKPKD